MLSATSRNVEPDGQIRSILAPLFQKVVKSIHQLNLIHRIVIYPVDRATAGAWLASKAKVESSIVFEYDSV